MEKYIADKDIDNGWMDVEFKRGSSSRPGVDMSKHCIFEWDFAVKESNFLVIRRSLVHCPNGRMLCLLMMLIQIDSKTPCPCHFCALGSSLTRLYWIIFRAEVDAKLTSNGDHFWGACTLFHDFEAIRRYMLDNEVCIWALSASSFGHYVEKLDSTEKTRIFTKRRLVENEILIR